jgi:hypothetical protein
MLVPCFVKIGQAWKAEMKGMLLDTCRLAVKSTQGALDQ